MAEALGGLLLDATGQDLAGGQINRQLAGDVVVVGEGDGLGVQRASRRLVGIAGADHQIVSVFHQLWRGAVTVGDDRIHLHPGALWQGGGDDHAARRQVGDGTGNGGVREEGGVDLVDGVQIGQAGQIDGDLDDIVKRHIDALQHVLDVAQALVSLLLDATGDQLARRGIDRQLGTDIVVVGEGDGMGRADPAVPCRCCGELQQRAGGLREGAFAVGNERVHLHGGAERQTGHRQHGAGRQQLGKNSP